MEVQKSVYMKDQRSDYIIIQTFSFWRVRRCVWYSLSLLCDKSCSSSTVVMLNELLTEWNPKISPLIFSIWAFTSSNCFNLSSFFFFSSSTKGVMDASFSLREEDLFSVLIYKFTDKKVSESHIMQYPLKDQKANSQLYLFSMLISCHLYPQISRSNKTQTM